MTTQALDLAPGTHLCCMYRGVAQRDLLLGPHVSDGLQGGHTCFVAVSDQDPDRVQAFGSADGPGELIVRTAADQAFSQDNFDIDDLGSRVVFEAMRVHRQIWLSGLVLENLFYVPPG